MNDELDIAAFLKQMAPPNTPAGAIELDPTLEAAIRKFDGGHLACMLGGLQTDPAYQANHVRLEWAARLALALGNGSKLPARDEVSRLLNLRLKKARIARLEDPLEDVMVERICTTTHGEFSIFTGTWEKAGHYTESVLTAFAELPEGSPKQEALGQIEALLRLSDNLVRRSSLSRYEVGEGHPNGEVKLPPSKRLFEIARRVVFTWAELDGIGISPDLLTPFLFEPQHLATLLDREPGNSPLEFHPLLLAEEGLLIAAPANLSTAIRGHLINVAISGGMKDQLLYKILSVQSKLIDHSGFVRMRGPILPFAGGFGREHVEELSYGRYLHVLHAIPDFGSWPKGAFTTAEHDTLEFDQKIVASVTAAHDYATKQEDFTSGISFIFLSGWGSGRALSVKWPARMRAWQIVFLAAQDGFILGGCEDGNAKDILWIDRQFHQVQEQGFDFQNVNGFLNLFQWWRNTEHSFVPPHSIQAKPPLLVQFDTDLLLQARREALLAWDRRVLQMPDGQFEIVMRTHPKSIFGGFEAIYGCYDLIKTGRIVSAVLIDDHYPVWFNLDYKSSDPPHEYERETFDAILFWASRVLPLSLSNKINRKQQPIKISLKVGLEEDSNSIRIVPAMSDEDINLTIRLKTDPSRREVFIALSPEWQLGLQRPDNYAEAALAAIMLNGVNELLGIDSAQNDVAFVRSIFGGLDVRWRHGLEVTSTIEALRAEGLLPRFKAIPVSVSAFVKTGTVWGTHPRERGPVIEGKEACRAFLDAQVDMLLNSLRNSLRRFRRDLFVTAVLSAMQAALAEQRNWNTTARALRAIHGTENDYRVSHKRRQEVNAVLRASSMLAELGHVECPLSGGRQVGEMDISEVQAHAILLFHTADLIPAIEGDRIEPRFNISPTGEMLHDHSFERDTLGKSATTTHEAQRDQASDGYMERFDRQSPPSTSSGELERAVEAEYGGSFEQFLMLAQVCANLAIKRGQSVFQARRSELISELTLQDGDAAGIEAMVNRLTLLSRDSWSDIPAGATARDFDLAKFDRRYSLVGRPLLALDSSDNPVLIVAPGVIERCVAHNLQGAYDGTLQGQFWSSPEMTRYVGERGRLEGSKFNEEVAAKLRDLGLITYASAKPSWCFNHKNTAEVAALGDFDVLAITPDGTRAWIVEAKDLKLCRTIGETARRLSEYEGKLHANGKPDKMLRHLRRVEYARIHARDLQKRLSLFATPEVSSILVVHTPQPMESFAENGNYDMRTVMLDNIAKVPWFAGWKS